jgi:DNA helicase II / ATP-dependent DNA helicase PcrA
MYVALTRARERLYLSHAQTRMMYGQTRYHIASRFLDEIPETNLKWLSAPKQQWTSATPAWTGRSTSGTGQGHYASSQRARKDSAPSSWNSGDAAAPYSSSAISSWRTGQSVFHTKFGEGVILTLEGTGDDQRAQVSFGRHGVKWLALSVAKLTAI